MGKKIYCLAEMAYQHDMEKLIDLKGGGERVLADMITLLKKNGYDIELYQFSHDKVTTKFRGHRIYGLGNIPKMGVTNADYKRGIDMFYAEAEKGRADGIYLLSMNLSIYTAKIPTITVSHGIIFNHCERNNYLKPMDSLECFKIWIRNATHTISCDTDSLHMMSVACPQVIEKMTYVPNYVDINKFKPQERIDDGIFRILYPRRLQHARGYHILMKSANVLLDKYENIEIIFAGKGNEGETRDLERWMATKDDRVKHVVYEPEQMVDAYKNVDLSLIPSCYAEGLSLSLLESIACGICTISTWVGGLSDGAQRNVNALVIPPNNADALTEAIEYVMNKDNAEHVQDMIKNGQNMIKYFSKERWERDILNIVKKVYGEV